MRLMVNGIDVDCVIGDRPDERTRRQRLVVDVVLELSAAAGAGDSLADTVAYTALVERIRTAIAEAECRLIERAAHLAARECLAYPAVLAATARVTKRGSLPGLESAAAECTLEAR